MDPSLVHSHVFVNDWQRNVNGVWTCSWSGGGGREHGPHGNSVDKRRLDSPSQSEMICPPHVSVNGERLMKLLVGWMWWNEKRQGGDWFVRCCHGDGCRGNLEDHTHIQTHSPQSVASIFYHNKPRWGDTFQFTWNYNHITTSSSLCVCGRGTFNVIRKEFTFLPSDIIFLGQLISS